MVMNPACNSEVPRIEAQPGPQTEFIATSVDIAIYGGAAGGGKSFALELKPLHFIGSVPGFGAMIFRRTYPEITAEGSLWDTSYRIYPLVGGRPREDDLTWTFACQGAPKGNTISFAHAEHEASVYKYQGSQIPMLGFDQLESFTEFQFFFLLSRNRSTCGVRPFVRATCNPDPDSWLKNFIAWWLDDEGRFPREDRSGKIRWFIRDGDEFIWTNTKKEMLLEHPGSFPQSVTFIPSKLSDNPILEQIDPGYRGRLMAMAYVDRMRLLHGDWSIRVSAGTMFRREWFRFYDGLPSGRRRIRIWDIAATEPTVNNRNPDWSVGLLMSEFRRDYFIEDIVRVRQNPGKLERTMLRTATLDGINVRIWIEIEPGSAGKLTFEHLKQVLSGYVVQGDHPTGDKATRAIPVSAAVEQGRVFLPPNADWIEPFIGECENFPPEKESDHDDQVDTLSYGFIRLGGAAGYGRQPGSPVPGSAVLSSEMSLDAIRDRFGRVKNEIPLVELYATMPTRGVRTVDAGVPQMQTGYNPNDKRWR